MSPLHRVCMAALSFLPGGVIVWHSHAKASISFVHLRAASILGNDNDTLQVNAFGADTRFFPPDTLMSNEL